MNVSPTKKKKAPVSKKRDTSEKPENKPPDASKVYSANLSKDFSSFDVLWFDLQTKVRELVTDLTTPMYNRSYQNMERINQFEKQIAANKGNVDELSRIVYNKTEGLDVFNEINNRISEMDTEFKVITQRQETNIESVMKTFGEYGFKLK